MTELNLDQKAALYAQKIVQAGVKEAQAKAVENLLTKTLGVLQEQGVYACMLFLFSRNGEEDKIAKKICPYFYQDGFDSIEDSLLGELPGFRNRDLPLPSNRAEAKEVLAFYAHHVCDNLDLLLLVKDLYEQTLIYARYGAKAEAKTSEKQPQQQEKS